MEPSSTEKRPFSATEDDYSIGLNTPQRTPKRPRTEDSWTKYAPTNTFVGSTAHTYLAGPRYTPPSSAESTEIISMPLKLKIPEHLPNEQEQRQAAVRNAAARRWAQSGKLQRSEPDQKEIRAAYNLKLMRHYPAFTSTPSTSVPKQSPPTDTTISEDFIKPMIQKSSRVTGLLNSFPCLSIPANPPLSFYQRGMVGVDFYNLNLNREVTMSNHATRLAWQSFASQDRPSREVMVESALPTDDMEKENAGLPNNLPEWKKSRTSVFARENNRGLDKKSHIRK